MFKDDFVWGVAGSAYQLEGHDKDDGSGCMIWDRFYEEGHIKDNHSAYVSADHMHRYKEDYAMMRILSIKANRFSVSWARLIPDGTGRVNEKAVKLYRDMILEMKRNGIEPYLTLYHWELPQALQDRGGWLNEEISDWFAYYARVVAENFSDICRYYFTLNEPECFVGLGYMSGVHAPGLKLPLKDVFLVAHNALKAHGKAVIALRKWAKQDIKIGFAPTCGMPYPKTGSAEDVEAARKVMFGFYQPLDNWTWNVSWFNDPVVFGRYPEEGLEKFKDYLPDITDEDMDIIAQPLDFLGQNIYNGYEIKAGPDGEAVFMDRKYGSPRTAAGWPVTPECFYWGIKLIYERYKLPLYITENGMSCHDDVSLDGMVHDPNRQNFLDLYISAMQRACDEGADVRGYFLWSFLDNFEWDKGYTERFGIVHVDFETLKRTVKDSAYWYKKVIETRGANLSINVRQRPILFLSKDCVKEMIWGREEWVISAFPGSESRIREGLFKGMSLKELYEKDRYLFGDLDNDRFPLLTKVIKADDDLSIQVHPDDAYAMANENGSFGKTECWYILDCAKDATIVIGHNAKDRESLERMIREGRWDELIREIPIHKGDFIQIEPGTIHAIKGGTTLLETQQSSDVTYRLYDYDRVRDGRKRELHIDKSIDVIKCPAKEKGEIKTAAGDLPANRLCELVSCEHYKVWKLKTDDEYTLTSNESFMNVSVIEGEGLVNGQMTKKGDHFILPNGIGQVSFTGRMTMIISAPG